MSSKLPLRAHPTTFTVAGATQVPMAVLVTGASGRLGRQIAQRLAQQGYAVIGTDRVEPTEPLKGVELVKAGEWKRRREGVERSGRSG